METWTVDRVISFKKYVDTRGSLVSIESLNDIPFEIKRIFYIYDVPGHAERGAHAHKDCIQVFVAISGHLSLFVDGKRYSLASKAYGLIVHPGEIVTLVDFSEDAVCLVLASKYYEPEDYIYESKISELVPA